MDSLPERLRALKEFLHGVSDLDGRWFGECHKPAFWWRKHLGEIDLALARIAVLEQEVKRLRAELKESSDAHDG